MNAVPYTKDKILSSIDSETELQIPYMNATAIVNVRKTVKTESFKMALFIT